MLNVILFSIIGTLDFLLLILIIALIIDKFKVKFRPKKNFIEFNANPKNNKTEDCAVRAITMFLKKPWEVVLRELTEEGIKFGVLFYSRYAIHSYLERQNCVLIFERKSLKEKLTLHEFCEISKVGTFYVETQGHAVYVENGKYYDTWNSGHELISYIFRKN